MKKINIKEGIDLYTVRDTKFKTMRVCIMFHRPLLREEVTKNTLLVSVMRMQCKNYETAQKLSQKLEELYGADLIARALKYGERQIIKLGIKTVADDVAGDNNFDETLELLKSIVLSAGANGAFSEEILNTEKQNIRDAIAAQKNDKRSYSVLRLQEEMCRDEAYGINPMGYIDDLDGITAKELYEHYKKVIEESKIDIIFTGNFSEEAALAAAQDIAAQINERTAPTVCEEHRSGVKSVRRVTDKMDVTQGKLCMGFRQGKSAGRDNYAETAVFNTVFGGSATSKLFENVREKLSLCYYVSSSVDRLKEIMTVRSGVECTDFEKAEKEIINQLEIIRRGEITDFELESAKKQLSGAYRANGDGVAATEEYCTMQILLGTDTPIEEAVQRINAVTREEVAAAARGCVLDTVYCIDKEAK